MAKKKNRTKRPHTALRDLNVDRLVGDLNARYLRRGQSFENLYAVVGQRLTERIGEEVYRTLEATPDFLQQPPAVRQMMATSALIRGGLLFGYLLAEQMAGVPA